MSHEPTDLCLYLLRKLHHLLGLFGLFGALHTIAHKKVLQFSRLHRELVRGRSLKMIE
jgi:hypothetical protein